VWGALRALGAERIDHGIHCLDDPSLVAYLARKAVPVTLCPISNMQLKVRACVCVAMALRAPRPVLCCRSRGLPR
jgi:adenosine deaminase